MENRISYLSRVYTQVFKCENTLGRPNYIVDTEIDRVIFVY